MKRFVITLLFLFAAAALAVASDQSNLKDALQKQYQKRVLVPRFPFQGHEQDFDSAGKPLQDPPANKWKVYGPVLIRKISLDKDKLRLEGPRVAVVLDANHKITSAVELSKPVEFKIRLDHPLNSADDASEILNRVFFLDPQTSDYQLPEYRRPRTFLPAEIYRVAPNNGISAPRAVYTPDPDYSDEARRRKYQGTVVMNVVVDEAGNVSRISIARPLGLGLDEQAVEKLKIWKFNPAMHNGQPVTVEVSVEVTFNLY
ncbi:MAG TPA: energy transducer TonB [Candidatus Angelobacter sp.]